MEVVDLREPQQQRFLKAFDVAKLALDRFKVFPANDQEKQQLLELDELESGYPKMMLAHLYDVIRLIGAKIANEEDPYLEMPIFNQNKSQLKTLIDQAQVPQNVISWRSLMGKVGRIKRLKIFDVTEGRLDYAEILSPGRVSIVDLSDTDSPQINNLVIAQLLRGLQYQQEQNYNK